MNITEMEGRIKVISIIFIIFSLFPLIPFIVFFVMDVVCTGIFVAWDQTIGDIRYFFIGGNLYTPDGHIRPRGGLEGLAYAGAIEFAYLFLHGFGCLIMGLCGLLSKLRKWMLWICIFLCIINIAFHIYSLISKLDFYFMPFAYSLSIIVLIGLCYLLTNFLIKAYKLRFILDNQ